MSENNNQDELSIWKLYLYALKSPLTREKYEGRIDKFFDFLGVEGKNVEEKSLKFVNKSKEEGNQWVFNSFKIYDASVRKG